ncbi:hypothetical protein [Roseateles flavus]|uniref:Lipase helper protein n=1 Tax=Roseateles flavus TaxID=3149041 RepID=A0ABV0GBS7_9BURK
MRKPKTLAIALGAAALVLGGYVLMETYVRPSAPGRDSAVPSAQVAQAAPLMPEHGTQHGQQRRIDPVQAPLQDKPKVALTLGDSLAMGVDAMQPELALSSARVLVRCVNLPLDIELLEGRIAREQAGAYKERMLRERESLMAMEWNCQTLPADIRTVGDAHQLRARLLRRAYSAHVPGAAMELLDIPQQFAELPIEALKARAAEDAAAGDVPTLTSWALLQAKDGDLESLETKLFAFALQRAARNPEIKDEVAQAQAVYARVLEQYWAKRHPEQRSVNSAGFGTDAQGAFLYPNGFDEPRDAGYQANARSMDAALIAAIRKKRTSTE